MPGIGDDGHARAKSSAPPAHNTAPDPCSIAATLGALVNAEDVNINSIRTLIEPFQIVVANVGP